MIEVNCEVCGQKFARKLGEVNRNKKRGNVICCSKSCQGRVCVKSLPNDANRDEFSPFRRHYNAIRNGRNRAECLITLEDLKDQWDKQQGVCPYTGWSLDNPPTTYRVGEESMLVNRASVDRIDSSKPYTRDNIQFVALMAQLAKNQWSSDDLVKFCEAVTQHRTSRCLTTSPQC